ncbi:MAG: methyltransferase [Candidatus Thermoplasmatota archaeon]|nr:methyltransferase [Candidatus Thermoplasmatota archaeon]
MDPSIGPMLQLDYLDIRFEEMQGVYPAREDTFFMLSSLKEKLCGPGKFLEMGCGSGICSILAGKSGYEVFCADRNPRALYLTRNNLHLNGLSGRMLLSDLFGGFPLSLIGSFDIMVFNPPYLEPSEEAIPPMERLALEEKARFQVCAGYIREGKRFLKEGGHMYLIASPFSETSIRNAVKESSMDIIDEQLDHSSGEALLLLHIMKLRE